MIIPMAALALLFQRVPEIPAPRIGDQGGAPVGRDAGMTFGSAPNSRGMARLKGQIVADTLEPLNLQVTISSGGAAEGVFLTTTAFANGSFNIDNIAPGGDYWIKVVDPRFKLAQYRFFLRNDEDAGRLILVPLLPREGEPSVKVLGALARTQVHGGEFKQAMQTLNALAQARPLTSEDRYFLGLAHYNTGNFAAAQQQFEVAISLGPESNPLAYVQLFNTLQKNGKPAQALTVVEDLLKRFPKVQNRKVLEETAKKLRATLNN
jgi:tetratricopeptide (TPR) repeat protein